MLCNMADAVPESPTKVKTTLNTCLFPTATVFSTTNCF